MQTLFLLAISSQTVSAQRNKDTVDLGKALEYFTSSKYHEALLIFQRLDKDYNLNDRFKAYIGLCYYHEWDYQTAVKYLDKAIPNLDAFAPHERSVYYFTAGECYFHLEKYPSAIPYYNRVLTVCYDREKPDIYYRLGLCYMFIEQWKQAYEQYSLAEDAYKKFGQGRDIQPRMAQIKRMAAGCWAKYMASLPKDSLAPVQATPGTAVQPDSAASPTPPEKTQKNSMIEKATDSNTTPNTSIITADSPPIVPYRALPSISPIHLDDIYKEKIKVGE